MPKNQLAEQLKKSKIRPSYQRIRILEYLQANQNHPTADMIYQALKHEIPALSKSTVYNTLITFARAGLVQEIRIDEPGVRFDANVHQHGHFQCQECSMLVDFDIDLESVEISGLEQHQITGRHVYFQGICQSCLAKKH